MTQSRRFAITSFVEKRLDLSDGLFSFVEGQQERCPTTGKLHWQLYVETATKRLLAALGKKLVEVLGVRPHIEICKGTQAQNHDYVTKSVTKIEGTCYTLGVPMQAGMNLTEAGAKILSGATALSLVSEDLGLLRNFRLLQSLQAEVKPPQALKSRVGLRVTFIHGLPGLGKTRMAVHLLGEEHDKMTYNKGFFTYKGSSKVLVDDLAPDDIPRHTLLHMMDLYPFSLNVKFGNVWANWDHLVITSNFHPCEFVIVGDLTFTVAFRRRITEVIHLTEPWTPPTISQSASSEIDELPLDA